MTEVIKKLKKDRVPSRKYPFVFNIDVYEAYYGHKQREFEEKVQKATKKSEKKIARLEKRIHILESDIKQLDQKIQEIEEIEERNNIMLEKRLEGIERLLQEGEDIASIADLLVSSVEEITALVNQIQAKEAYNTEGSFFN
jgi:hypothetical protein